MYLHTDNHHWSLSHVQFQSKHANYSITPTRALGAVLARMHPTHCRPFSCTVSGALCRMPSKVGVSECNTCARSTHMQDE